ncbi:MAG: carboxypeptidase-like regulatory domain-containing protein, partial [Acidobacteriaceae bacterium]
MLRFLWYLGTIPVLLALWTGIASPAHAQIATTTASISGTVADPTGAVLPRAVVTLVSTQNGISRTFTTENAGRYIFSQLPPASYTLSVKARGFKVYEQMGIILNASESATQDVSLTVGSETQSIMVTADTTQLNTDNSNVAADIPGKDITEYPLNIRNVYSLATLNASVSNTSEGQMLLGGG